MAIYAIGDVQGCFEELQSLLDEIGFDQASDQLWLAGDLVNRGPDSLKTLRFVRDMGAVCVLGNHDLHLLASALLPKHRKRRDTLDQVMAAPDWPELMDWLRHRPLIHHDATLGYTLLHAGLPPQWDLATALDCAREVEQVLRGDRYRKFFKHMYGNQPARWSDTLDGYDRLRFITNCFTRLRFLDDAGELALDEKGPPGSQAPGLMPWYQHPERKSRRLRILFGHWSTLGALDLDSVHSLDTGCLWGGQLTALRLDSGSTPVRHTFDCPGQQRPPNTDWASPA